MIQRRQYFRLAFEAPQPIRIPRKRILQNLDRNVPLQFQIARPIHLAHAAGSNELDDLVAAQSCTSCQGHGRVNYTQQMTRRKIYGPPDVA
jgi:hypothetical protein